MVNYKRDREIVVWAGDNRNINCVAHRKNAIENGVEREEEVEMASAYLQFTFSIITYPRLKKLEFADIEIAAAFQQNDNHSFRNKSNK